MWIQPFRLRYENKTLFSQFLVIESLPRNTIRPVLTETCVTKNKGAKLGTALQKITFFGVVWIQPFRLRYENKTLFSQFFLIESLPKNTTRPVFTETCFTKNKEAKLGTVLQKKLVWRCVIQPFRLRHENKTLFSQFFLIVCQETLYLWDFIWARKFFYCFFSFMISIWF